jgi:hypothetical protein
MSPNLGYKGILFYAVLALLPFLISGYILAGIMQSEHRKIHMIYFADLFGAGLGAAAAIFFMNAINPVQTVGVLTFIVFAVFYLTS